jgi:hypothetical protein
MARRIFSEYLENVQERMGQRSEATDARVEQWLNDAVKKLGTEYVHKELQGDDATLTIDVGDSSLTPSAPLADEIWWPEFFKNLTTGSNLEPGDLQDIERLVPKPDGAPSRFYWRAGVFYFNSTATEQTDLRLWYVIKPEWWNDGVAPLDDMFDLLLELTATSIGFGFVRDFAQAHIMDVQAQNYIAQQKLPLRQARLNDYQSRVRVRRR